MSDLTFERILGFLRYLEGDRHNHVRTRNQRLAALHTLFDYIASREPEMLGVCQQVAAIPMKRAAPAETHFLERDEVQALFRHLPRTGRLALRDRALLLFLYNTGARVQEVADLRAGHLELGEAPLARLHGKGDKWRTCPLWRQTAQLLAELLGSPHTPPALDTPVFCSTAGQALTRFGIYKIVRRHAGHLDSTRTSRRVSPHIFRHTAAVHLLEAGVEVNVIRGCGAPRVWWRLDSPPRCSGLGGRCLPRYRRMAEPQSDHFPLLFYRTSVQLRCPVAPPGGGLRPARPSAGAWASPRRAPAFAPRVPRAGQG